MRILLIGLTLWAAGCCSHGDLAREAMRVNAHLAETSTTDEGRSVAEANLRLWKAVADE